MESNVRLIHKTYMSYFPTSLPVSFYGLPDGKVYIIYSRFYEVDFDHSGLEFVFAVHEEFSFNFRASRLFILENSKKLFPVLSEMVDKPEPNFKIIKVLRNLNSYNEAESILNNIALELSDYTQNIKEESKKYKEFSN